jgi:signal transduction histidine kinase
VDPAPTVHNSDSTAAVVADLDRLSAVIGHIVQNAQEATSNEGSVAVRTYVDNEWSVVEVTDTGCGMDQEFIRTRLFRPFDTTKGNAGMGVGVYESREFAMTHGGAVDVVSQPEKGTTFRIKLPRYSAAAEGETPMRAAR